jgi:hypothetical protein
VGALSFFIFVGILGPRLESTMSTPSGHFERYSNPWDERDFTVRLTRPDGSKVDLEMPPQKLFESDEKIVRRELNAEEDEVVWQSGNESERLGVAKRVFHWDEHDYTCEALGEVHLPTPLAEVSHLFFSHLKCDEKNPTTQTQKWKVLGKKNQSWVDCANSPCVWNYDWQQAPEAASQVSALAFLWTADIQFKQDSVSPAMRPMTVRSIASNENISDYNGRTRNLSYGAGNYLDALDGFVVVHEWGHAVIEDLNPGIYGYEGNVLHEAVADFVAAHVFNSPCIAPFDAQEITERKCVRDLSVARNYATDMLGAVAHQDSLVLSSALWELRAALAPSLALEVVMETVMRLPKKIRLFEFWSKCEAVYARLLLERPTLKDLRESIDQIGQRHGLTGILADYVIQQNERAFE